VSARNVVGDDLALANGGHLRGRQTITRSGNNVDWAMRSVRPNYSYRTYVFTNKLVRFGGVNFTRPRGEVAIMDEYRRSPRQHIVRVLAAPPLVSRDSVSVT
jgi:hypothetical protein